MEDSVAVIAKNEEEALSILEGLEHDDIIDAFDEEYEEVDNKENALRLAAGIGLGVGRRHHADRGSCPLFRLGP